MRLYVPSYIHTLGHAPNRVLCVCTVTEDEKTALKAMLPRCSFYFKRDDYVSDDEDDYVSDDEDDCVSDNEDY